MVEPDLSDAAWHKSSLSGTEMNCVEVAFLDDGGVAVRNSKRPDASVTELPPVLWTPGLRSPLIIRKDVLHARTTPPGVPAPRGRAGAPR